MRAVFRYNKALLKISGRVRPDAGDITQHEDCGKDRGRYIVIRKANVTDVKQIAKLIKYYAARNKMLPRSLNELYENIRDFFVYTEGKAVYGCCALHIDWEDLGEIKSLAVARSKLRKSIGRRLLESCLKEARALKLSRVFALTYAPEFFKKRGFAPFDKQNLPHKIWNECIRCVHFPDCGETAMLKELKKDVRVQS
ncbi:MAG: N-acetyltransferase [Candidatus Omnitrophota bacterium]